MFTQPTRDQFADFASFDQATRAYHLHQLSRAAVPAVEAAVRLEDQDETTKELAAQIEWWRRTFNRSGPLGFQVQAVIDFQIDPRDVRTAKPVSPPRRRRIIDAIITVVGAVLGFVLGAAM